MKILVVLANPKNPSVSRQLCDVFCESAKARGHDVLLRDLYAMGFNPVASAADLSGNLRGEVAPDVAEEQAHVLWADLIVLVHPIWWIDRPAILKGWIDRVFALGFAYGYSAMQERGTLAPRSAVLITTAGSSLQDFEDSGKLAAIRTAQDMGTMEFSGLEMLGHLHFGPVGRRSTPEQIAGYLAEVRAFVAERL
jgi:NAD(P)H dehydrogenase (quinone)